MKETTCLDCRFFLNDAQTLERLYPGLNTLSSAWGCVRGDAGCCSTHDVYLFPRGICKDFSSRGGQTTGSRGLPKSPILKDD